MQVVAYQELFWLMNDRIASFALWNYNGLVMFVVREVQDFSSNGERAWQKFDIRITDKSIRQELFFH